MSKVIDLTGQTFNRLTVIARYKTDKHGRANWLVKCECGEITSACGTHLRRGKVVSCGCFRKEGFTTYRMNNSLIED